MSKDPLLNEDFFSLHLFFDNELRFALEGLNKLEQLIKQKLYPHLSPDQNPTYYQGSRTLSGLSRFIYQNEVNNLHSDRFKHLQVELRLCVTHIRAWAVSNQIEGVESLSGFLRKLEQPSDTMALLYGDGKLLLEKLAVLLNEPLINLEARKTIVVNFLADKELEKCIAGCYSRIASAVLQLQENLEGDSQIKQWLHSYAKMTASYIAAKRPFAMPDTYQVMVCKASDSAVDQNLLHANNYLLMQAKEHGFPIDAPRDQGAIELENGLTALSKKAIIDLYIKDLEQHITAKNLVHYISEKLHASFTQILSENSDYADKSARILNKLNLLGEDIDFNTNTVGLEEILTDMGALKTVDALQITVTRRLQARKLLKAYETKKIIVNRGQSLEYYGFNSEISFTWFLTGNQRTSILELIKADRLAALIPLTYQQESSRQITMVQVIHEFIKDTASLISVIKSLPASYGEFFINPYSLRRIVAFSKNSDSVRLFIELLTHIPDQAKRTLFINECGNEFVKKMLYKGLAIADIKTVMPGLAIDYSAEAYSAMSGQEALSISKELIKQLIDNGFTQFSEINFVKLPHPYLEQIDFSDLDLQFAKFFQTVRHCQFDRSKMDNVNFFERLEHLSFRSTDLRRVSFQSPINTPYIDINLENAQLSTNTFKGLRSACIVNFVGVNLKEVNFQDAGIKFFLEYLDFTNANLESCDLSKLKLNGAVLWETNLAKANLIGTELNHIAINPPTNLAASQLNLDTVDYLYRRGIKNFAGCKIYSERRSEDPFEFYTFHQMNFKKAEFMGEKLTINFIESDLSAAVFTSKMVTQHASRMTLSIVAKESHLEAATFRHVKLSSDSLFLSSTFTQLNFDDVEMSARFLFALYTAGQRDFTGVKSLQGPIPQKLVAFPVLGAKLKKSSFLHLYRQGLRDFRGSNLNSFYLSQVLAEQAISAIDLKLEGAEYKQSPLGCVSSSRHKRSLSSLCTVHFLFQKTHTEKRVTLTDIEAFTATGQERFSLKELVLGPKPLYILSDEVNAVNFYWGYRPDEEVLIKVNSFIKQSISAFEVSELKNIHLRFHLPNKFGDITPLSEFAINMGQLGFSDVKLHYYNQQTQLSMLAFKNGKMTSISALALSQQYALHADKFRALLKNVKLSTLKIYNKEEYRARLRHMNSAVRRKMGSGIRTGIRNGAQYEIGATIIYFIGEAINNPSSGEIRVLAAENKTALKQLAYHLAQEVGQQRGASERQVNLTATVAGQCIDRGECATEEEVIRDVVDSMQRMRTDLMIGNEYAWNNTKTFFVNVGSYLSNKFDELKLFFAAANNQSPTDFDHWRLHLGILIPSRGIQKRRIYNWYESPLLMRLIKDIESVFSGFGIDLQHDENFSEAKMAGFLSQLWRFLDHCGVSNNVTDEFTLNLLKKVENTSISENFFNHSQPACNTASDLPTVTALPTITDRSSGQASHTGRRRTRDIKFAEKVDCQEKSLQTDEILDLDDHYHLNFENRKKTPKPKLNKQSRSNINLFDHAQTKSKNRHKQRVEKNFKTEKSLDQKQTISKKHFNQFQVNEHQHKPTFLSPIQFTKQAIIDIKVQTQSFKNNHLNYLNIGDRHAKKWIKLTQKNQPLLRSEPSFFRTTHSGISEVSARSDTQISLFALNFCIQCLSKEKKSFYTSKAKPPKLVKMEERAIEMKRNFYKLSSNKK
jgi:uncharacterized protein YjbI with pentapeptide repeats